MAMDVVRVCFVCLGNICRSPTAEGILLKLVLDAGLEDVIAVESAGTGAWHVGEPADERSRETARARGVELRSRALQFVPSHFHRYDYVIAVDRENLHELERLAPDAQARRKVQLLRNYDPACDGPADVPDPYYGGPGGFDRVFDICAAACRGLLDHLVEKHALR